MRKSIRLALALCLVITPLCLAQALVVGAKGGAQVTATFTGADAPFPILALTEMPTYSSTTQHGTLGLAVDFAVSQNYGVEVDCLGRQFAYDAAWLSGLPSFPWRADSNANGTSVDIPILVKRRLTGRQVRPYLGVGSSIRRYTALLQTVRDLPPGETGISFWTREPGELERRTVGGAVLAAGLETHAKRIKLSTEFRYTRWLAEPFQDSRGSGFGSRQNQVEILVGIGLIALE